MSRLRRYCLITPCRDEERFARRTLDSITSQTVPPTLWVIVDDGSKDRTPEIVEEYTRRFPYIRLIRRPDRGDRVLGSGVIDAFYTGYNASINPDDFDYICKLDLDLDLPPTYFQNLIERMEANPRLGTCSGKPYFRRAALRGDPTLAPRGSGGLSSTTTERTTFPISTKDGFISEKCGDENSVGMVKFYRTLCFKQIGGFVRYLMWDGIDGHRCRMLGWMAESWDDPELRFVHLRPMGTSHKSWWVGRERHGIGQYYMGTAIPYMIASSIFRMTRPPVLIGGIAMLWGYFKSMFTRAPRYDDANFRSFLRRYQYACLLMGKKRATEIINQRQHAAFQLTSAAAPQPVTPAA